MAVPQRSLHEKLQGHWWDVCHDAHRQGWDPGRTPSGFAGAVEDDARTADEAVCSRCGYAGLDLLTLSPLDGSRGYRAAFACPVPACGWVEEFGQEAMP